MKIPIFSPTFSRNKLLPVYLCLFTGNAINASHLHGFSFFHCLSRPHLMKPTHSKSSREFVKIGDLYWTQTTASQCHGHGSWRMEREGWWRRKWGRAGKGNGNGNGN